MGFFQGSAARLELLSQMMEQTNSRIDADLSHCGANNIRSVIISCLACRNVEECQHWLAEVEGEVPPPEFCANARRLKRMRVH